MTYLKSPKASFLARAAWSLYDWGNSAFPTVITTFIFATYFTQVIAQDPISGTHQWGDATAIAGLVVALLSPILGAIVDQKGKRKPWIACFTLLAIISSALLWFAKPSHDYVYWVLTWVVLGTIGFEIATVFYNAMLHDLVPTGEIGRLSGWAWGIGYAGGLACLVIALLFVQAKVPGIALETKTAEQIRISGPLVAIWFALFSLPLFLFTPDKFATRCDLKMSIRKGLTFLMHSLRNLRHDKDVWKFLLAQMIYIDGLNTLFAFGGIYAAGTFGLNTEEIIKFGIAMNVTAGIGAIGLAWLDDYLGSKTTILISLMGLVGFGTALLFVHSVFWFWVLALSIGLFVGPVQAASRSLMAHLAPPERMSEIFGLYALSGKATAYVGPWLVGLITLSFHSQRVGMAVVMVLLLLGAIMLMFVRSPKNNVESSSIPP